MDVDEDVVDAEDSVLWTLGLWLHCADLRRAVNFPRMSAIDQLRPHHQQQSGQRLDRSNNNSTDEVIIMEILLPKTVTLNHSWNRRLSVATKCLSSLRTKQTLA